VSDFEILGFRPYYTQGQRFTSEVFVTRKISTALRIGLSCFLTVGSLAAHHSFAPVFDGEKKMILKGVVTRFDWINPHSFIYVEVQGKNGVVENWALEGPAAAQLNRRSLPPATVKVGDNIEACGYGTKDGVSPSRVDAAAAGRLLSVELLTLQNGQKLVWSNYGQGKCLPAGLN